jgi:hypothetical protein
MYESNFDCLKGKEIVSIEWNDSAINFNLKDDTVSYEAVGDCCSSSHIEDLDNPEIFKNAVFDSVAVESGETKDDGDYTVQKWTFYKFKTSKGMCTLSFRNDSNGYYNGWLEKSEP